MNWPTDLNNPTALARALDRLVADDLPEGDRRAVLCHLDASPDGWRRCALAFLEDQALRSALSPPAALNFRPLSVVQMLDRRATRRPVHMTPSMLAAGITLIAAGLGFGVGSAVSPARPSPNADSSSAVFALTEPKLEPVPGQPVGWVSMENSAEGESLPRQIPVLAATAANEAWLQEQPAAIPAYVKAQWERRGYLVEENRRLVGLDLEDGRHVAVPVDELALDYVGRQPL